MREIEHQAIINQNTKHQSISITDRRRLKSICILSTTEFNHIELSQSSRAFFLRTTSSSIYDLKKNQSEPVCDAPDFFLHVIDVRRPDFLHVIDVCLLTIVLTIILTIVCAIKFKTRFSVPKNDYLR